MGRPRKSTQQLASTDIAASTDDFSKPISLRVDSAVFEKIKALERTKNATKSAIIKNAIERSYAEMIIQHFHKQLFELLKRFYSDIKIDNLSVSLLRPGAEGDIELDSLLFEAVSVTVQYALDYPDYECVVKENKISYSLKTLNLHLAMAGDNSLKLKVSADNIIVGNSSKLNGELFFKIAAVAHNHGLQTATISERKNELGISIFFERSATFAFDKWEKSALSDFSELKKALDEINNIFSNDNSLTVKKQKK